MTFLPSQENNRFAWLTPIQKCKTTKGPWVLCENRIDCLSENSSDSDTRKVAVGALLSLAASVSGIHTAPSKSVHYNRWESPCLRFVVVWYRQRNESSRLFVQNRDDHYARIELHIDEKLVLAFQEPVWPHLQSQSATDPDTLNIPAQCLLALEAGAAAATAVSICSNDSQLNSGENDAKVA